MTKNLYQTIGRKIKLLRIEHNLSQYELAKILGVGQTMVSYFEAGHTTVKIEHLIKLSKYFGISITYFVED